MMQQLGYAYVGFLAAVVVYCVHLLCIGLYRAGRRRRTQRRTRG